MLAESNARARDVVEFGKPTGLNKVAVSLHQTLFNHLGFPNSALGQVQRNDGDNRASVACGLQLNAVVRTTLSRVLVVRGGC